MPGHVLIVDDDQNTCDLLGQGLERRGFTTAARTNGGDAFAALSAQDFDVVLTDLNMPGMRGIELCRRIVANRPDVPVIVVTAFGSLDTAIEAIRAGAYDFITKPFEIEAVELALERAIQQRALREEVKRLRSVVENARRFDELLGESEPMRDVRELLERIVDSDASVLVSGETGTGKEVVARALHRRGRRREGPFVAFSCAAMPETLVESELFGHVRGAFTDARADHRGLFLQADGGTLFLDEIGNMPAVVQAKLLRALQERAVRPVGGAREIGCDVRIIAATNRDLDAAVEDGSFRADLLFRIDVIHVRLPPVRARGTDVLLLAHHFLERYAAQAGKRVVGLSPPVAEKLLGYTWPGNVRELQNCIERAVALARYDSLVVDDLTERIRDYSSSHVIVAGSDPSELVPLEEVERRYILRVLEAAGGNKTMAAQILGLDRKTLYRKLERYGQSPRQRDPSGGPGRAQAEHP
jgi:two-component system response regulator HydG